MQPHNQDAEESAPDPMARFCCGDDAGLGEEAECFRVDWEKGVTSRAGGEK